MSNNKEVIDIIEELKMMYPDAKCSLDFTTPFELGIAVALSAQCTDERVNKTTPEIFNKYNKPEDFANMDIELLEKLIHPCGFYKNKARNIKGYSKKILEEYNGQVPKDIQELMKLPGIGRKSANVIMLEAFDEPVGIAVDTHCRRIANRIGLSKEKDPNKIEKDLLKIIPNKYYKDVNHLFIWHGRNICTSRKPKCENCKISKYCNFFNSKD